MSSQVSGVGLSVTISFVQKAVSHARLSEFRITPSDQASRSVRPAPAESTSLSMQTSFTGALTPNMLAVGKDNPGPIAQTSLYAMLNTWDVRSGRNYKHAVWQDELKDAMASIDLDNSCITEEPPEPPVGSSLCAYSHNLWVNAVLQYQDEGTKLFDIVRPSLLISTDYAQMDLRAISEMKRGQVKDGRALLRWAMSFVDYSSLSNQIKLMEEMNEKKLEVNATKLQLSTHMISLLELWLQKEGANINKPAEYFQRLLMSMPTEPEGALVRVRSKIADMINEDSIILQNLDGEDGFFARINKYAESQGVKEVKEVKVRAHGSREFGSLNTIQADPEQCSECYSWICKKMATRTASASTTRPSTSTRSLRVSRRTSSCSIASTASRTLARRC